MARQALEHYLDVGALAGTPLQRWRSACGWPASFDWLGQRLDELGQESGTRAMIELLHAGQQHGWDG